MIITNLWQNILKNTDKTKPFFTILLPPPNITGSLHIGHFLNWSLQDLLMRKAYMQGKYPNWIAGIDHAGIATQFIVERELAKTDETRIGLGREKFNQKVLEWKRHAEKLIEKQALDFGFFFDWSKKRFTMDDAYQKEVLNAFVQLYNDGLITKNYRITNWDTEFQTALSDLEVIERIEKRKIYVIRYDALNGPSMVVATTRPETIFGDAAICVHPDDERYKHLLGKKFQIPLINKEIPLIQDAVIEIDKGVGALKVTPAHDAKDNLLGEKHGLECVQIINKEGRLFNVPERYLNKTTQKAREQVVQELEATGHLLEVRDWEGIVYYAEKSQTPLETIMTEQWFLDTSKIAKLALEAPVEFIPSNIRATFEHWMHNIKPWCISRQIWYGHQIPIWYKEDGTYICAKNAEEAQKMAPRQKLRQESDVLDTWFSSALWPIATQEEFLVTDILITGKDILFFWVARMIMFTLYFKNKIPFKTVYFNGIVRDAERQKMSKTKGNVLNPLDIREQYGNDALRFALLRQSSWGKDIAIRSNNLEDGRAFCTKFKNATKFVKNFMSKDYKTNEELDSWIASKIATAAKQIDIAIEEKAFHEACTLLYDVFWNNFCAWYIEGLKVYPSVRAEEFLCTILKIAHPIIPWISEECFQELRSGSSILDYKEPELSQEDTTFDKIINITKFLRKLSAIAELKSFYIENVNADIIKFYTKLEHVKLGRCENNFKIQLYSEVLYISHESATKAKTHFEKELKKIDTDITTLEEKICVSQNVPQDVLCEWKERLNNLQDNSTILKEWLENLSSSRH